ncbi:MAG: DinB family protein [Planctomycetes bacterium]|nr:DinB family protein [Planctomycetota bacterium]
MNEIEAMVAHGAFARERTLGLLANLEKETDPAAVLGWRPGAGRAHLAWQLMHIGVTEELFATERLVPGSKPAWPDLVARFRGGSTPDDHIPAAGQIRDLLAASRSHLQATLSRMSPDQLDQIPPALAERGWTLRTVLSVLAWHEAHHQGQAHITYNLWKARQK